MKMFQAPRFSQNCMNPQGRPDLKNVRALAQGSVMAFVKVWIQFVYDEDRVSEVFRLMVFD